MKIAIIGYGKMGKTIEQIALERGHSLPIKANRKEIDKLERDDLAACDVAIEFSRPEAAVNNIRKCIEAKLPVIVGTTGWYKDYYIICNEVEQANSALLAATNFSVGVNLFFELNRRLARLMGTQKSYKASMTEIHHLQKLDSPSGTAISLAEDLISEHPAYQKWVNKESNDKGVLSIISDREAEVPGTHIVNYSSNIDEIEIKHLARSRKGFGLGAVLAAEFLAGKSGIYQMKDVLKI